MKRGAIGLLVLIAIIGAYFYYYNTKKNNYVSDEEHRISLKLEQLVILENESYQIEDFVVECHNDISDKCEFSYEHEDMGRHKVKGRYKIIVVATIGAYQMKGTTYLQITDSEAEVNESKKTTTPRTSKTTSNNSSSNNSSSHTPSSNVSTSPKPENSTSNQSLEPTTNVVIKSTTKSVNNSEMVTSKNTFLRTEKESTSKTQEKYGTVIETITTTYYNVYSDGTRTKKNTETSVVYHYESYNANTETLKNEAQSLISTNDVINYEILKSVNQYRKLAGTHDLVLDNDLCLAANIRALEMAWSNVYNTSHKRPDNRDFFSVLDDLNIEYRTAYENIDSGSNSANQVMSKWHSSVGANRNIVSTVSGKIGIGYYKLNGRTFWVQIFTN